MVSSRELDRLLARAERVLALLDRCRPLNWDTEVSRVTNAWCRGDRVAPLFRYANPPEVSDWLRILAMIADTAREAGPLGYLYAERARELWLDANLVQSIGKPEFASWAERRFPVDDTEDGILADAWTKQWTSLGSGAREGTIASDDERDSRSLVALMRREVGRLRLPVRIVVTRHLASSAAAGDGIVYVRAGFRHTENDAHRIVLHEIFGHVVPRIRSRFAPVGILRVGTQGANEDEEGRALLLEQRASLFDTARCREVAIRHISASLVRAGADWVETVRELCARGAGEAEAIAVSARAHRGGGLAREIVYLPALARVTRRFEEDPALEAWFLAGRVSTEAASFMAGLAELPELPPVPTSDIESLQQATQRSLQQAAETGEADMSRATPE